MAERDVERLGYPPGQGQVLPFGCIPGAELVTIPGLGIDLDLPARRAGARRPDVGRYVTRADRLGELSARVDPVIPKLFDKYVNIKLFPNDMAVEPACRCSR